LLHVVGPCAIGGLLFAFWLMAGDDVQVRTIALVSMIVVLTTSCGYAVKTTTDYDRNVSFATYHTFFMIRGSASGNPLLDQRVIDDVRNALTIKGWEGVPEGEGRTAVVVHAATNTKHSYETFYKGWGGWRWGDFGTATTDVDTYKVGSVIVDMFDAATKQLIWRGAVSDALTGNAERNASITQEVITKLFHHFPPGHEGAQ
jgi:Domain of unknown function (DUF4136)